MVVKSATKKKLMDMGIDEDFAHRLADDRKWDNVKELSLQEIGQICQTGSDQATRIHEQITRHSSGSQSDAKDGSQQTTVVRRKMVRRTRASALKREQEPYISENKMEALLAHEQQPFFSQLQKANDEVAGPTLSARVILDISEALQKVFRA